MCPLPITSARPAGKPGRAPRKGKEEPVGPQRVPMAGGGRARSGAVLAWPGCAVCPNQVSRSFPLQAALAHPEAIYSFRRRTGCGGLWRESGFSD